MISRATDPQHAKDELEFRQYLHAQLGDTDAQLLVDFVYENAATPVAYVTGLAHLVKGVGASGPGFVGQLIELAKKPKEAREAEMDIAVYVKLVIGDATHRIRCEPAGTREQVADELWREVLHRTREKLNAMWPGTPDYIVNGALLVGMQWDRESGHFNAFPAKIVDAMRRKDPVAS